jgi:hypothetical protein
VRARIARASFRFYGLLSFRSMEWVFTGTSRASSACASALYECACCEDARLLHSEEAALRFQGSAPSNSPIQKLHLKRKLERRIHEFNRYQSCFQ